MSRTVLMMLGTVLITGAVLFYLGIRHGETPSIPRPASPTSQQAATTIATSTRATTTITTISGMTKPQPHPAASTTPEAPKPGIAGWKKAIATVFWVGEGATDENSFIHNASSAWDVDWETHFGGLDDPDDRCGFRPCAFTPKENPFYVALPYNDLDDDGDRKSDARFVPWNDPATEKSVLKNRWVEVSVDGKSCFGQWQDVGPFHEDDVTYVFGTATTPKNTEGEKAGIDLSPAMATCLGVDGSDEVMWRHVSASAVPAGPWKEIVTTRVSQ